MAPTGHNDPSTTAALVHRILHPLVIVAVSLVIGGGALLSGTEFRSLAGNEASLLKMLGGAVFLVLVATFFQQQMQMSRNRRDLDRRYRHAAGDLDRMVDSLRQRTLRDN